MPNKAAYLPGCSGKKGAPKQALKVAFGSVTPASVPAIFAITKEPLIVFISNILAILGLRSLYFMLAGVIDRFIYLKIGLALVLVFVGLKMAWLNQLMGGKFPIGLSLGIIGGLIAGSILISMIATRSKKPKTTT